MWKKFYEELPKPYKDIKIDIYGKIWQTRTILHVNQLHIKLDQEKMFRAVLLERFPQELRWSYI